MPRSADAVPAVRLRAAGVSRRFGGVKAVDGVELQVLSGECLALVGESGSGKTTLLRMFNRLVDPDEGEVLMDGAPLSAEDPIQLRRRFGYVPQQGGLLPHWTVARNVSLVPDLLGMAAPGLVAERLREVGLPPEDFAHRWPRTLSGGQRQRVALARALAHRPSALLLDEPFGALDALTRSDLQRTFRQLVDDLRLTAILVTHDLEEARRVADRIAVMRAGKIVAVGTFDELAHGSSRPETDQGDGEDYVARLFERAGVIR